MPKISFSKGRPTLDVPISSNLMQVLLENDIAVASSCGGEGVCAKCVIKVIKGAENLSPMNDTEKDLREIHDFSRNERLSCQTTVLGDVTLDTDYW